MTEKLLTGMLNKKPNQNLTICYRMVNLMLEVVNSLTGYQGPVVQSIVSLTTVLRHQFVKYMPTKLSNTVLFFCEKM